MKKIKYILQILLLLFLIVPTVSQAVTDPKFTECGLFPSALNTWDTIDQGNGDNVINADTIYADSADGKGDVECKLGGTTKDCIVEEFTSDIPNLPSFIKSTTTTNTTASGTLRNEKYGDITVPANANITFDPSGEYNTGDPVMVMQSLTIEEGATVTFGEGDYWIEDWRSFASINIRTTGAVRLFIKGALNLTENHIDFNYDSGKGEAKNMFIFVYGNFLFASNGGGDRQYMSAYVYVQGSFTANHNTSNSKFVGAVTSVGTISLNNNQTYEYDDSGLDDEWGACDAGLNYNNADDVCYYEVEHSGSGCTGSDEFKGGVDCTQTIHIRNLSNKTLKNSTGGIFTLDHSGATITLLSECGVDGVALDWDTTPLCEAVNDWPINLDLIDGIDGEITNYVTYEKLVFEGYDEHSIFTKSAISASLFDGGNLYAIYNKSGSTYAGRVNSCDTTIQFELSGYEVSEDINRLYLTEVVHPIIKINKILDYDVTVEYYTTDGTAKSGLGDYLKVSSHTATIPAGKTRVEIELSIYNDQPIETSENFYVHLKNPSSDIKIGYTDTTTVTILAQDDAPTCFEDEFDDLNEDWRVLSAIGGFTPGIVNVNGDGRLRITDSQEDLSTVVTRDVEFESSQNLIIIEFDYYAYGGCGTGHTGLGSYGADGTVNILFDATVGAEPSAGGFGGSMGYAQFDGNVAGFEGGWLGLGLDEYGNFGRDTESRDGGSSGLVQNNAVIRGEGSGMNGYTYLTSVQLTGNDINALGNAPIAEKNSNDYYSGRYKMTVDARDSAHLYINLMRAESGNEGDYQTIIDLFDAKDSQYGQSTTPDKIRYAISGGTGGGCNKHELSWIKLRGNCSDFTPSGSYTTGPFASQDSWREIKESDFNISTKIVNEPFNVTFLSLDETGIKTEKKEEIDARWSLKYIYNNKGFLYAGEDGTTYYNIKFDSSEYEEQTTREMLRATEGRYDTSIIVDKAYQNMYLEITYCAEYDSDTKTKTLYPWSMCGEDTSGAVSEDQTLEGRRYYIHEGDHFATRASWFQLYPRGTDVSEASSLHAGKDFNLTLCAYDGNQVGTPNCKESASALVKEYNQDMSNITLQKRLWLYNDSEDSGTLEGTLKFEASNSAEIVDGMSRTVDSSGNPTGSPRVMDVTFDNVGNVEVGIIDEKWAEIDADDSPATCMDKSDIDSIQAYVTSSSGAREPFSRYICMRSSEDNLTMTFIPDYFEISNTELTNHRNGSFTYLANDIDNMSGAVALSIEAKNSQGITTTNFNRESDEYTYPDDNDGKGITKKSSDKYYENPVTVTFEMLDLDNDGHLDNPHPLSSNSDYDLQKRDISTVTMLGFNSGKLDINSTSKLLVPYYRRKNNEPVMPFDINMSDMKVSVQSVYPSETISGDAEISKGSINFYYARLKPKLDFYEDIIGTEITTPIMLTIFCSEVLDDGKECKQYSAINGDDSGKTNERNWYKSRGHTVSQNDGNGTLEISSISEGSGKAELTKTFLDPSDGIDDEVIVERGNNPTLPMTVVIDLDTNSNLTTSPWLIYGETLSGAINDESESGSIGVSSGGDDKPTPFYRVRFIDGDIDADSDWTGIGPTGSVIDRNTNKFKNNRMNW